MSRRFDDSINDSPRLTILDDFVTHYKTIHFSVTQDAIKPTHVGFFDHQILNDNLKVIWRDSWRGANVTLRTFV